MNAVVCLIVASLAVASAQFLQGPSAIASLRGPDGSFIASSLPGGSVAAPFIAAQVASPFAAVRGGPLLLAPQGSGLEGQYIPDNLESLYDDGSYKPWLYGL